MFPHFVLLPSYSSNSINSNSRGLPVCVDNNNTINITINNSCLIATLSTDFQSSNNSV
jgi:hypothetical protein